MRKTTIGVIVIVVLAVIVGVGLYMRNSSTPAPVTADTDQSTPSTTVATPTGSSTTAPTTSTIPVAPRSFTLAQIATHNNASSCYTTIGGSVYDLTPWINQHPGGPQAILSLCGKDGTAAFTAQHGGQAAPANELATLKIGLLAK